MLGEGRPKLLSGTAPCERRQKAHIWARMCFYTTLSICGQTNETTLNLWLCSQKHTGRQLSSTTEQAVTSGWGKTLNPDLPLNHIARHQGVTQLKVVKNKKPLDKLRTEFKPLISFLCFNKVSTWTLPLFVKMILACNRQHWNLDSFILLPT